MCARSFALFLLWAVDNVGNATCIEPLDRPRVDGEDTETCLLQRVVEKTSRPNLASRTFRHSRTASSTNTRGRDLRDHKVRSGGELNSEVIGALHTRNRSRNFDAKLIAGFIILGVTGGLSILLALACCIDANNICDVIRTGIETFDTEIIGTVVTFKHLYVDILRGTIQIFDMTVHNPKKEPAYSSEYLFHVGEVNIVVNMRRLIWTRMSSVDVHRLIFKNAKAFYERPSLRSKHSNLQDVLHFIEEHHRKPKLLRLPIDRRTRVLQGKTDAPQLEHTPHAKQEMQISIKELDINDVAVGVICSGRHPSLTVPQLRAEDFQKECDGNTVTDIVHALVNKIGEALVTEAMDNLQKHKCVGCFNGLGKHAKQITAPTKYSIHAACGRNLKDATSACAKFVKLTSMLPSSSHELSCASQSAEPIACDSGKKSMCQDCSEMSKTTEEHLLTQEEAASTVQKSTLIAFGVVGMAAPLLWNQLMLNVSVLTALHGRAALAEAGTAQNVICGGTMMILSCMPWWRAPTEGHAGRIVLCIVGFAGMIVLAPALGGMLSNGNSNYSVFMIYVGVNGACTGMIQNLGAALSGRFTGAPAYLLVGDSLAPLVAVGISTLSAAVSNDERQAAGFSLRATELFLWAAVAAMGRIYMSKDAVVLSHCSSVGTCVATGGSQEEYVFRRVGELVGNSCVAFIACLLWVLMIFSSPFMALGLCGEGTACATTLPPQMMYAANMAASGGRLLGLKMDKTPTLVRLLLEIVLFALICGGTIVSIVEHWLGLQLSITMAVATGVIIYGCFTLWANFLLMKNNHSAQASCGHSVVAPCNVTSQIMWLSMQIGCIAGTFLAQIW